MSFDLTQKIKVVNPTSNIDELYGPYTSVANALAGVPVVLRQLGRTVGIIEGGTIKEYWFKNGTTNSDLVEKSGGGTTGDFIPLTGTEEGKYVGGTFETGVETSFDIAESSFDYSFTDDGYTDNYGWFGINSRQLYYESNYKSGSNKYYKLFTHNSSGDGFFFEADNETTKTYTWFGISSDYGFSFMYGEKIPDAWGQIFNTLEIGKTGTIINDDYNNGLLGSKYYPPLTENHYIQKKYADDLFASGGTGIQSIGNKEYKISLSDLDVTGWEDPTFDDKVAEHIQTLDITVANNEIPYFVVEEPAPEPSNSNFRIQADWGGLGVTDQTSFETWLNTPNINGWNSGFGKYLVIDNLDDGNQSVATYTISNFSLVGDIVACNIDGNGNCFDLGYCNIQEIISLPNNLIYSNLSGNQLTSFDPTNDLSSLQGLTLSGNQLTSFDPTNELSSLQGLYLDSNQLTSFDPTNELSSLQKLYLNGNQISDWSQVTWIESIPNNGSAYLEGNPTSANSSLVYNALQAKSWYVSV